MSAEQYVYDFCYDWVDMIINPTGTPLNVPIIQAFQDAPAPKGTYLAIGRPSVRRFGRASAHAPEDAPLDLIERDVVSNFTAKVQFWQVFGYGEHLRALEQDSDLQASINFFTERKIALYTGTEINYLPTHEAKETIPEYRMELTFGFAVSHKETLSWIEDVQLVNNIGEPS